MKKYICHYLLLALKKVWFEPPPPKKNKKTKQQHQKDPPINGKHYIVIWGITNHFLQLGCIICITHAYYWLFGINRKEILSGNIFVIRYFYLWSSDFDRGFLWHNHFCVLWVTSGYFELVAKLAQNSPTKKYF